ncbi:hypothetical protein CNMCM6106_006695 [Aspergillus hiratsukae]|uniref:BL00235/CARNS1 N-terminal domain-containing protein n=1 Tax=Aspergillus hiratsukae TaxID=1194566 RepID=A0A8H6QEX2_9EURO|nr:hypothetical protein CNMCM6106_006695 [Aspergillus hiratsukae]
MADTTPQGEGFTSETFVVRVSENAAPGTVLCRWRRCGTAPSEYFHAIDLLISVNPPQTEQSEHANSPEAKGTVLEVSLIVLNERDHWLAGETYAHLREEFIALDLSARAKLPDRIAAAVRGRAIDGIVTFIDGIVTFTDEYVVTTAEAAEILGLPTEPAPVMRLAHHKHEMRRLLLSLLDDNDNDDANNNKVQAVRLYSATQLDHPPPALAKQLAALQYPLVVKPCRGQFSTGVKKVSDEASLRQAVAILAQDNRLAEQGIMLETYISGPELDANFVLLDGAVLFLEVTDNFAETLQISNTRFPAREVEAIRQKLSRSAHAEFRHAV